MSNLQKAQKLFIRINSHSESTVQNGRFHDSLSVSPPIRESSKKKKQLVKTSKESLSKVISTMIAKYKEGKIKESVFQQSLIQMIHKGKKTVHSTKKKKGTLNKKTRESEYSQRILDHKDFVNSIVLKGIQSSLFYDQKDIYPLTNAMMQRITTSDSTKQVSLIITQQRNSCGVHSEPTTTANLKQMMAIRIQRAWRQYSTNKLIKEKVQYIKLGITTEEPKTLKINKNECSRLKRTDRPHHEINQNIQTLSRASVDISIEESSKYENLMVSDSDHHSASSLFQDNDVAYENFSSLQNGLRKQRQKLKKKKAQELESIGEKYLHGEMKEEKYNQQRASIEKWYQKQLSEISKIRSELEKSFKKAGRYLHNESFKEKSIKILRCLSDKYIRRPRPHTQNTNEVFTSVTPILQRNSKSKDTDEYSQEYKDGQFDHFDQTDSYNNSTIINTGESNSLLQSDKFLQESQEMTRSLLTMTTEDKEQVYQFIFLDLVLQLFVDESREGRIMRGIEEHIAEIKRLQSIPKGVRTSINSSKEYLKSVYLYVSGQRKEVLTHINEPMGPSALQMLSYMHDVVTDADDCLATSLVLSSELFETISRLPENEPKIYPYFKDAEKEKTRVSFLKSVQHIKNKALFDSLNEMLDEERPYGVWGKPFPWKHTLSVDREYNKQQLENKFRKSIERTIEDCSFLCGILADKEESLFIGQKISEEYIEQIREDRMSKMLAQELLEKENRWIFYDDEQTEVLIQITRFITVRLIKEFALQITRHQIKV